MSHEEAPLDAKRPIIDPHLHVWDIQAVPGAPQEAQRFLLDEAVETIARSGHNITHSVFVECHQMHRVAGPPELRPVGETEFVNGIAAMSESGSYGPTRVAHRIVGTADLRLGAKVRGVLEAHMRVAGERFRGIRMHTAYSDASLFGQPSNPGNRHLLLSPHVQAGARVLADLGLTLDVWNLGPQLGDLIALADAVPDLVIVLDHVGTPEVQGERAGPGNPAFMQWREAIRALAKRPNVRVKLGGLGMELTGSIRAETGRGTSGELADQWRPCIECCIEAFTPARAMFESNFPPDKVAGTYGATWNAFKILSQAFSEEEKDAMFRRTAAETYLIEIGS